MPFTQSICPTSGAVPFPTVESYLEVVSFLSTTGVSGAPSTSVTASQRACWRHWRNVCEDFTPRCNRLGSPIDGEVRFFSPTLETPSLPGMPAALAALSSGDTVDMALLYPS